MPKQLKPWISFSDQLKLLQRRGMVVENPSAALSYLERVGYYRLSGYWYPFRECDTIASQAEGKMILKDQFIAETRFQDVVQLYIFDKKLRLLALDALERIEMAVRVDVAHLLGEVDPIAHKNPACLHGNFTKKVGKSWPNVGKTGHQVWLEKYKSQLSRAKKEAFVQHHRATYGELPIWASIEVWDFGLLSRLFSGMKHTDQQKIATKYGAVDGKEFAQWLRSLNFIRNVSAHHSRLWNANIVERASVPSDWSAGLSNARPFLYFCIMQKLLKTICPHSHWGERLHGLFDDEFPEATNKAVTLEDFGIVEGWEAWDVWG